MLIKFSSIHKRLRATGMSDSQAVLHDVLLGSQFYNLYLSQF